MDVSFSIVMPNYNSAYLKRAIQSVIAQSYDNWELIIIDDYSSNFPEKIVEEINNDKIKFYKYDNSNNIARSRNIGIKKSKYEWIAFLDADDVWKKNKLSLVKKEIIQEKPDFIYHGMYYLPKTFGLIKKIIKDKSNDTARPIFNSLIKNGNSIANSSVVVKKKLLINVGLQSEDINKISWEDYDCWIKCAKKTNNFLYVPKILGYVWIGGGNISSSKQTYINNKNFHKIYKDTILKTINKKKTDWYTNFLLGWYFKKKMIYRSYILDKKINKNDFKSIIKSWMIKFIFFKQIILKIFIKKIKKFISEIKKYNNIVLIYKHNPELDKKTKYENNQYSFQEVKEYSELNQFKNIEILINKKDWLYRLKSKDSLFLIKDKNNILAYGWGCKFYPINISEINKKIQSEKSYILYDFHTSKEYRNQGLYQNLLSYIINHFDKTLIIFSLKKNIRSNHAIKKVGFKKIKELNIFSNDFIETNN